MWLYQWHEHYEWGKVVFSIEIWNFILDNNIQIQSDLIQCPKDTTFYLYFWI